MRIIILGGTGMLGHKMFQTLKADYPTTVCTTRDAVHRPPFDRVDLLQGEDTIKHVDVTNTSALETLLHKYRPDYTVNCVGVIKQRPNAHCPLPSIAINSLLPHQLAAMAAVWGGRVIHFSTDCVFSGKRGGYTEEDPSDAADLYGRSKFLGETTAANALTLRTSIIGRELAHHASLLDWFLAQNHKSVRGFTQAIYSGVTTNYLAGLVSWIIGNHPTLTGLFQVVSIPLSKYALLMLLRDAYALDIEIVPDDKEHSDRSMNGKKFRVSTGQTCPTWSDLVQTLVSDPTPYERWMLK